MPITLDGTLGITTPALTVTGATVNTGGISTGGNLTFTTSGSRILGDMTTGTIPNRLAFQTSTANSTTVLTVIPSGTSTTAALNLETDSALTNASIFQLNQSASESRINSTIRGTGTYVPLTFYTGGSERMRIDTSGNVGIGTSSPNTTAANRVVLDVNGTTSALLNISSGGTRRATFYSDSTDCVFGSITGIPLEFLTGGVERVRITSAGLVGIGTTSPSATLHVTNADLTSALLIGSQSDSLSWGGYFVNGATSSTGGSGMYGKTNAALYFNSQSGYGHVWTINGTERMRIDSSGNVGIGTSSPSSYFSGGTNLVVGNASGNTGMTISSGSSSLGRILFADGTSGAEAYQGWVYYTHTDNAMTFATSAAEKMRIDSSGNVGIGTSSPSAKLHVYSGGTPTLAIQDPSGALRLVTASASNYIQSGTSLGTSTAPLIFSGINAGTEFGRFDASSNFYFNSGYGSSATAYGCRAWVNFNGTGTIATRASGNVSSLTDNGTGDYTVNFTTAMPDANYSVSGATRFGTGNNRNNIFFSVYNSSAAFSTGSCRVNACNDGGSLFDVEVMAVMVVR